MIKDLREEYENVLVLDSGDFFWKRDYALLRTQVTISALKFMKYDALNIADGELLFDLDLLQKYSQMPNMPLISSNIRKGSEKLPWSPYVLKTMNGFRVAILGIVSPDLVNQIKLKEDGLKIEEPLTLLTQLVPEMEKESDFIVLLAHTQWKPAITIVEQVKGINAVIVGHDVYSTLDYEKINETVLLKNTIGTLYLGVVKVWFDAKSKKVAKIEPELIELDKHIAVYPEYTLPETTFENKKYQTSTIEAEKNLENSTGVNDKNLSHDVLLKKFDNLKDLSPEEFLEKVKASKGDIYENK